MSEATTSAGGGAGAVRALRRIYEKSPWLTGNLVTFVAYVASGSISVLWLHELVSQADAGASAELAIPWLAPGFAAAAMFLFGRQVWPAVLLGSMTVWTAAHGGHAALVLLESIGEALSIVVIVTLLRAWGYRPTLERYTDSLYLLLALAIGRSITAGIDAVSVVIGATVAPHQVTAATLRAAGIVRNDGEVLITGGVIAFAVRWWANTWAGCVLVMPLLALFVPTQRPRPAQSFELVALGAALAVWLVCVFALPPETLRAVLFVSALLLVVWAADRFGAGIAGAVTLALVMAAAAGFGLQLGTFAGGVSRGRLEATWGFLGLLSTAGLFLSGLLSQRQRARRDTAASVERYRRLFDGNPFPMWAEDPNSGGIRLANPAALRVYGYRRAEFLALRSTALRAEPDAVPPTPRLRDGGAQVTTERHRLSRGDVIDVEVTRALIESGGVPWRVCFVEQLAERNAMRLAILNASDLERFRLGQAIRAELMPHLTSIAVGADNMARRLRDSGTADAGSASSMQRHVDAIRATFRRLTRGTSPLADANGDLTEALERLPQSLPAGMPPVRVTIHGTSPMSLAVERREHIYRLAEDAVRHAGAAAGVQEVHLLLNSTAHGVAVIVDADSTATGPSPPVDEATRHSMAVRAAAARGHLSFSRAPAGGSVIRFDCDVVAARRADAAPAAAAARAQQRLTPTDPAIVNPSAPPVAAQPQGPWLAGVLVLAVAYFLAGALPLSFLWRVDALGRAAELTHWLPWIGTGVAVAGLMLGGERLWPGVAIGYFALWAMFAHSAWPSTIVGAAARSAAVVLIVRLVRRHGGTGSFGSLREIVLLLGAAAVALLVAVPADLLDLVLMNPGTALVSTPEVRHALEFSSARFLGIPVPMLRAAARWWLNSVTGVMLCVPAITAWSTAQLANLRSRPGEFATWSAMFAAVAIAMLAVPDAAWRLPILGFALTTVTWAAVRFGAGPAYLATLLIALVATVGFGLGDGILTTIGVAEGPGVLWAFVILLATTAHLMTTLLAENDRAERVLKDLDLRYRALFEAVPHALFAYEAATGCIRLANREAIHRFGYGPEEFDRLTLADLDVSGARPPIPTGSEAPTRITTQFCTRSGALVDVELALTPVDLDGAPGGLCFAIDVSEQTALHARMIEATDRERRSTVRELHDELGQLLTGLLLGAAPLTGASPPGRRVDARSAEFVAKAAREALRAAEHFVQGVSPLQESGGDLLRAIRRMPARLPPESRGRITVNVTAASPVLLSLGQREHLYRIAQEAVTNALKHADASHIGVAIAVTGAAIDVTVADDGVGFDPEYRNGGLGLDSLSLRAAALRGTIKITTNTGGGTMLRCRCPQVPVAEAAY